ncbi:hypothetical protein DFH27DRAFT_465989, partial [Peziza echinospora]
EIVGANHCISNDILWPGTQSIQPFRCITSNDVKVVLIDTPGFNDTGRSEAGILKELTTWLQVAYMRKIKLSGIIYFHKITETRMEGSALRNLKVFQTRCGDQSLKNVILITT